MENSLSKWYFLFPFNWEKYFLYYKRKQLPDCLMSGTSLNLERKPGALRFYSYFQKFSYIQITQIILRKKNKCYVSYKTQTSNKSFGTEVVKAMPDWANLEIGPHS